MSTSYSAIILDESSRSNLIGILGDMIPKGWEIVAHHMTITMGSLLHRKGKYDFTQTYAPGTLFSLSVTEVGIDERVMAVKVDAPFPINSKISFPHVTVAVNREAGGKPFHSNKIAGENFENIQYLGIVLKGTVVEVPQK